jgi:hypothetical protein
MMRRKTVQMADGFTFRGVALLIGPCVVAEGLSMSLTDPVAGQFTVEGLIESTLLGRSKDPVLFHPRD